MPGWTHHYERMMPDVFHAFEAKAQEQEILYVKVTKGSFLPGWPTFSVDKWHPDVGGIDVNWIWLKDSERLYRFSPHGLTKYYSVTVARGPWVDKCKFEILDSFKGALAGTLFAVPRTPYFKKKEYTLPPVGAPSGLGRPPRH